MLHAGSTILSCCLVVLGKPSFTRARRDMMWRDPAAIQVHEWQPDVIQAYVLTNCYGINGVRAEILINVLLWPFATHATGQFLAVVSDASTCQESVVGA